MDLEVWMSFSAIDERASRLLIGQVWLTR